MRVNIVYRNYKPLHDLYASFQIEPPTGVTFIIPRSQKFLRRIFPIYRKFGDNSLVRFAISKGQGIFFEKKDADADIYHFLQLIPNTTPDKPYVIDFEHASSLANFVRRDDAMLRRIIDFLNHSSKIMPLSYAAQDSLKYLIGDNRYDEVANKIQVVYPALPNYCELFNGQADYSYVNPDKDVLRILFVGNKLKGLRELLAAFSHLSQKYNDIELYVVSNMPDEYKDNGLRKIKVFQPRFSRLDIIKKFYLACDLFVLPTHADTFGMAILSALSCGTPVITTNQFASPEIIEPGENGVFVHSDKLYLEQVPLPDRESKEVFNLNSIEEKTLIDELIDKIECLYFARNTLAKMSQRANKEFDLGGKFSVGVRNKKLLKIYEACLSS